MKKIAPNYFHIHLFDKTQCF